MHAWTKARRYLLGGLFVAGTCTPVWARFQPVSCKNPFTQQQEITEGSKVSAQVYQQMPVLPDNSPVSQYVRQLGAKLVNFAPGYKWPYNFHVVASEDINAFALPGGSMFVNLGTVQAAETESQLAGVMAHELSHVVMRHATCNMAKQQNKSVLYGIGSIASQILLGNGAAGQIAQQGIGLGASLDFLHMSRDDEKQADLLAVGILYDAGYDPRGLPQFFETIQAKYGAGGAQLLSDHPNPGNRTQYVSAEIATLPARTGAKVSSAEFDRARALAQKEKAYSSKDMQSGAWKQTGHYAAAAGGPAQVINGPAAGQSEGQGGGAVRLSRSALGVDDRMLMYRGQGFAIGYPASWQKAEGQNGSVAFVPPHGSGSAGMAYGALIETVRPQQRLTDTASLERATTALEQQLSQQNGGLQQVGQMTSLDVGGQAANAVELRGRSPVTEGGSALGERDWLVTVARPDGDLNYMVFVSPEADFEALRPVFSAMVKSFRTQ